MSMWALAVVRLSAGTDLWRVTPVAVETRKQQRDERRTRLTDFAIAASLAALTVAALIAVSQAGLSSPRQPTPATTLKSDLAERFSGIPQHGDTLGRPDAPLTLVEFADLQCPFCAQYALDVLPTIIDRYVRTGYVRLVFRPLRFLGPDSRTAAAAVGSAASQNRMWEFVDAFYHRQGAENSVTSPTTSSANSQTPSRDSTRTR